MKTKSKSNRSLPPEGRRVATSISMPAWLWRLLDAHIKENYPYIATRTEFIQRLLERELKVDVFDAKKVAEDIAVGSVLRKTLGNS